MRCQGLCWFWSLWVYPPMPPDETKSNSSKNITTFSFPVKWESLSLKVRVSSHCAVSVPFCALREHQTVCIKKTITYAKKKHQNRGNVTNSSYL